MKNRTDQIIFLLVALLIVPLLLPIEHSKAQSGVLVPTTIKNQPDAAILSLQVMNVDVLIDNQHATVKVLQIFDNHVERILEGKYLFALPQDSSISDFAIWEGDSRIPGVILERRRANEIYTQLTQQQIDPGLLQQDDEHGGNSAFSAKVFPIPAYGSKRIEMEYTEMLSVEELTSQFTFPLKASFGENQRVGEFNLHIHILSDYQISQPELISKSYPMRLLKSSSNEFECDYQAYNIELKEDLSFKYQINSSDSQLSWIAYRAPEQISAYDLRNPSLANNNPDGFFEAAALFNLHNYVNNNKPRNLLLLLDTSLSMYGEKLTRAVESLDFFLHSLTAQDQFNLVLFNEETSALAQSPLAATPENIERAMSFIKSSMLYGGTDLRLALLKARELVKQFPLGDQNIVLISDANPTLGTISSKQILQVFDEEKNSQGTPGVRIFTFALGSDSNNALLSTLAEKSHGDFIQSRETEDISTQLKIFFEKIGKPNIEGLRFNGDDKSNFYQIYSTGATHTFDKSNFVFVGRYKKPQPKVSVKIQAHYGKDLIELSRTVDLPEFDDTHAHLPRLWARARVDALLREMNINGEREDYIAEIIRLSQKYKFVTPYTAFLAAPRALLRPRLIQPGDPVLRVKTDESITSVFVVLPFGETLPLKYLTMEKVWEARFLAPPTMPDGTYNCRLLMTDKNGNGYQETKSFVIDSHAPKLKASAASGTAQAGDELLIRVTADSDTSKLIAKMYGAQPIQLYWSQAEKANIGKLRIPKDLAAGRYLITISAEDFAYNQSSTEIDIEVLGK